MADAPDLGSGPVRGGGSSPLSRTTFPEKNIGGGVTEPKDCPHGTPFGSNSARTNYGFTHLTQSLADSDRTFGTIFASLLLLEARQEGESRPTCGEGGDELVGAMREAALKVILDRFHAGKGVPGAVRFLCLHQK